MTWSGIEPHKLPTDLICQKAGWHRTGVGHQSERPTWDSKFRPFLKWQALTHFTLPKTDPKNNATLKLLYWFYENWESTVMKHINYSVLPMSTTEWLTADHARLVLVTSPREETFIVFLFKGIGYTPQRSAKRCLFLQQMCLVQCLQRDSGR